MALISFARRSHIVTELLDIRIAVAYTHSLSQTPVFIVTQFNIIMFAVFFCARERFADRLKLTLRLRLNFRLRISLRLSIGFVGFFRKPLGFFKNRWVFSGFLFRPAALCTVYPVRLHFFIIVFVCAVYVVSDMPENDLHCPVPEARLCGCACIIKDGSENFSDLIIGKILQLAQKIRRQNKACLFFRHINSFKND